MPKVRDKKTKEVFHVFRWKDGLELDQMPSWIKDEFIQGNVRILSNGGKEMVEVKSYEDEVMFAYAGDIIAYSEKTKLFFTATLEYMEQNYEKIKG